LSDTSRLGCRSHELVQAPGGVGLLASASQEWRAVTTVRLRRKPLALSLFAEQGEEVVSHLDHPLLATLAHHKEAEPALRVPEEVPPLS
jgi:hypothetical protein